MAIITVVLMVMRIVFVITLLIYYGRVIDAIFHPLNSVRGIYSLEARGRFNSSRLVL